LSGRYTEARMSHAGRKYAFADSAARRLWTPVG
jgi:hypothetical protein